MLRTLRAAGISQRVLDMVPDIVNTCRECRLWQKPGRDTKATSDVAIKINDQVETDLMFYQRHIIWHGICRASRWHATREIQSKEAKSILEAFFEAWVAFLGPPRQMYMDGESSINTDESKAELKSAGTELVVRAPSQHCRYIERRGAILRATMHSVETQRIRENRETPFGILLSESTFAGNALTTVGQSTPYQVIMGRQPAMLPELPEEGETQQQDGSTTDEQRQKVRELALQSMIQHTATAKIHRSMRTPTSGYPEYKPGDLVDYHRPSNNKDTSGWHGPVPVIKHMPDLGQVLCKIAGKELPCRLQDVRLTLLVLQCSIYGLWNELSGAHSAVLTFLARTQHGKLHTFGYALDAYGRLHISKDARLQPRLFNALIYIATTSLKIFNPMSIRIGKRHPKIQAFSSC